jgi:stress response protein YsnF
MKSEIEPKATDIGGASSETISIVEEIAKIDRREITTGRVRVVTRTETVAENVEAALETREAKVTRVPIDRYLEAGEPLPRPRTEGGLTIIPVLEEVLVVETRILLKEEVHIEMQKSVDHVAIPVSLRKQKAEIERLDGPFPADPISQT